MTTKVNNEIAEAMKRYAIFAMDKTARGQLASRLAEDHCTRDIVTFLGDHTFQLQAKGEIENGSAVLARILQGDWSDTYESLVAAQKTRKRLAQEAPVPSGRRKTEHDDGATIRSENTAKYLGGARIPTSRDSCGYPVTLLETP